MDEQCKRHGAFSWCELLTSDVEAAKEFYTKLFGWNLMDVPMGPTGYTLVHAGEKEVGGMMKLPPEAQGVPPHWGVYVTVDDVDAVARMAEELGGTVHVPPRDIPQVGRFCVLQDPQGAVISAISYRLG